MLIQIWWNKSSCLPRIYQSFISKNKHIINKLNYRLLTYNDIVNLIYRNNFSFIFDLPQFKKADYRLQSDLIRILLTAILDCIYIDLDVILYDNFVDFYRRINQFTNVIPQSKCLYLLKLSKKSHFTQYLIDKYLTVDEIKLDVNMIDYTYLIMFNDLMVYSDFEISKYLYHEYTTTRSKYNFIHR